MMHVGRFLCALTLLFAPSMAEGVVYSDSTFADGDWDLTVVSTHAGADASVEQVLSDGCPSVYRGITIEVPSGGDDLAAVCTFHRREGATHDPAVDGGIDAIVYGDCGQHFAGPSLLWIGPALSQDGTIYVGNLIGLPDPYWISNGFSPMGSDAFYAIDPADDDLVDTSRHPDFSTIGSPLEFGFVRYCMAPAGQAAYTSVSGVDNWYIEALLSPQTPIRPSSWTRIKARYE